MLQHASRRAVFTSWFTYILLCKDNSYYVGITNNLKSRIKKHNSGKGSHYTSGRGPVKLIYYEKVLGKSEARKREIQLKSWSRKEKQLLVKGKLFR